MTVAARSGNLIVVGGGARSGKSRFALEQALQRGPRRLFVATAEALDEEMTTRIARHREERRGQFQTVEEPVALAEALDGIASADVILVDCLTLWVSNLLVRGATPDQVRVAFRSLEEALDRRRACIILVTNEVGMGLVPETALGRTFRDLLGELHQRLAGRADELYAAVMGVVLRLHPGPVALVTSSGPDAPIAPAPPVPARR